jgi:imidazolonepropionase-like amidohydrolase
VLLGGDPAEDIAALSSVAYTIVDGKIVYRRDR